MARSNADGCKVQMGKAGSIAIVPPAFSKPPYHPARQLFGNHGAARSDFALVVQADSAHRMVTDLLKAARALSDRSSSPLLHEVFTFVASGLPTIDLSAWFAVFAPADLPASAPGMRKRQIVVA